MRRAHACVRQVVLAHSSYPRAFSAAPKSPSVPTQQALNLVKALAVGRARLYAAGALLGAGAAYAVWRSESESGIVRGMCRVMEAGGRPGWDACHWNDARAVVARPGVDSELAVLLLPAAVTKYAVVVGPSGTGKSTSVRKLVRSSKGVLYFSTRELIADFALDLARTVGYRTPIDFVDRVRRAVTGETKEQAPAPLLQAQEPRATWFPLSRLLREAASLYRQRHGRAPTLVLDAMDLVAKSDPAFFAQLQDFAKACADSGVLRVVLVLSDGAALPLLLSSAAQSRCDRDQVCEVGDIDLADAVAYIQATFPASRYAKDEAQAWELVRTVTGGRFPLLQDYGKTLRPVEDVRRVLDIETRAQLRAAQVPPTHPLLAALLDSTTHSLPRDEAEGMLEAPRVSALLRQSLLATHPDGTYTFNTAHGRECIRAAQAAHAAAQA